MKLKRILGLASLAAASALVLASCGDDDSSSINSSVPYGTLDLDATVATALNGELKLNNKTYYNKLRASGASIVTNKIKKAIFSKELDLVKKILVTSSQSGLTEDEKNMLIPTKNNEKLFSLDGHELSLDSSVSNYEYIRNQLIKAFNSALSNAIYSISSYESLEDYEANEIQTKINKFITEKARIGQTYTASDLTYQEPTDDSDVPVFDHLLDGTFDDLLEDTYIVQAQYIAAQNALYQIADEEYIHSYTDSDDDKSKNTQFYIYDQDEDYLKDIYESTYQTYGTYHAIIIQFDSLKIASSYTDGLTFSNTDTLDDVKAKYLALYNNYYKYKPEASCDADAFTFVVNSEKNDLNDISSSISTLVKDTLEENPDDISKQYLAEARNIDNKYVMALKFDTSYDVNGSSEETEWDDLSDDLKETYKIKIKYDLLTNYRNSYVSKNLNEILYEIENNDNDEDDLFIYDPVFEHSFKNSYTDVYNEIDSNKFNENLIFSLEYNGVNYEYSVTDFYNDASKANASNIIYNYFQLEYAYNYYDEYIDEDTHDDNVDTLDSTIEKFNNGENSSYSTDYGLENFLLSQYGYDNKDDVIKYYYDASNCLKKYQSTKVFKEWAIENPDNSYSYDPEIANEGILCNILNFGNNKYKDLFNINLDHVLIYIDDDGDGSPDDPEKFLSKNAILKDDFEADVADLLKAVYDEAIYIRENYAKTKTLYEIIAYIRDQYDLGEKLLSDNTKSWDDYKTYNFLLKCEQLASSEDITQSTVNNFVEPFKNYVINIYKTCVQNKVTDTYKYGTFYVYDNDTEVGKVVDNNTDITPSSLCATSFGYHLLILNSYDTPEGTDYTDGDDPSHIQSAIKVLVYEDEDDEDNNIYVTTNSYNDLEDEVSIKQLFIYYCQKNMGQNSSLDSKIQNIMSSLFDEAITTYTSTNFQNYLLINYLNIDSTNNEIKSYIEAEKDYYQYVTISYDDESEYYDWVFGSLDWTRPDQK